MEKPDFLPFQDVPIPEDQCLQAVRYIVSLSIDHGQDISSEVFYTELTGHYDVLETARQRRVIRRLASVVNSRVGSRHVRSNEHLLRILSD